ncbi:MAG: hypothetical protein LBR67_09900 [Dysgonamonadaceae bacterium]|nr:hypothetical protein [Dysgonamonadaceae bacterium]
MKRSVLLYVISVGLLLFGVASSVSAALYKNDSKEKKELSGNSSITSLFREDVDGGGGIGFDLLYPNDDLPEGPPIGVPVDESACVFAFLAMGSLVYIAYVARKNKRQASLASHSAD